MTEDPRITEAIGGGGELRASVRECRLVAVANGKVHSFASPRTVIGADPRADVVLADPSLSRFHCEIAIDRGRPVLRDLGSRNGSHVDGVPVLEAPLRDGALLLLGRTQLRFEIGTRNVDVHLSPRDRFGRLVGGSIAMRAAYALLEAAAASDATVLLHGESGTGKDLAAESIHLASARRDGPFVVVDCGAIPGNLLEVELFGHEAGAFTGAASARTGAFEAAAGGTLFLDEIGELALDLQPKLLRAIDRREVQRVGSSKRIPVDVRIIAATNRRLVEEVNAHRFRNDLYFRLAVLVVRMPPLRDRASDIPAIVAAILDRLGDRASPMARALDGGELLPELLRHAWPGNVRELRNYVERCLAGQPTAPHDLADPAPAIDITQSLRTVRERWVHHIERQYLERLLAAHRGNVSAAARTAEVDRVHLHRLIAKHRLR
ncbi:MAG: sigma 54-interacting transcriptional regulator [Deltaproteobacteria bacterium]|nr:sigma 54-interacting transcriptional regulator [Deltaproteobacteria bacterium]MCW5803423.1 sigma 54-interacting transcriptional regulator [Deltaproteobacteria bacterium]